MKLTFTTLHWGKYLFDETINEPFSVYNWYINWFNWIGFKDMKFEFYQIRYDSLYHNSFNMGFFNVSWCTPWSQKEWK